MGMIGSSMPGWLGPSVALTAAMLVAFLNPAAKAAAQTQGFQHLPADASDRRVVEDLVIANHVLAEEHVVDGFGHLSARSIVNPHHFYMSRSVAPALVTAADIMEFDENGQALDPRRRDMYGERFIHSEIYRARPDVMAVAHSHSPDILPFTVTGVPFKALIHTAAFLGSTPVPLFDSRNAGCSDSSMLVHDSKCGASLARTLGNRAVVLMRGHGMTVTAPDIHELVLRSIYTQVNARVESAALTLGHPKFLDAQEAKRRDRAERQWPLWVAEAARGEQKLNPETQNPAAERASEVGQRSLVPSLAARIAAMPKNLPRAEAPDLSGSINAARAAVAGCAKKNAPVSVLITDSAGQPVVLLSGDGAGFRSALIAQTKANIVIKFRKSSSDVAEDAKGNPGLAAAAAADPGIGMLRRGGLPIIRDHKLIGAIAVSGGSLPAGDLTLDEQCARIAQARLQSR